MKLLNEIQQTLKVPKGQYNSFSKFYYRNAEDILEAVKPLLGERGTLIIRDEVVNVGGHNYVKATVTLYEKPIMDTQIVLPHEVSATGYAKEAVDRKGMDDSQITGSTSSYARKYALNGLFCIDDTKDADGATEAPPVRAVAKPVSEPLVVGVNDASGFDDTTERDIAAIAAKNGEIKKFIVASLKKLGKPCKTAKECQDSVFDTTGEALKPENFESIAATLNTLIVNLEA